MRLYAEWEKPKKIILVLPSSNSDWNETLDAIHENYRRILKAISSYCEILLCFSGDQKSLHFIETLDMPNVKSLLIANNDTWVRDFAPICIQKDGETLFLDFGFNGWGLKYPANFDNLFSRKLKELGEISNIKTLDLILEGGSIESDGNGVLLTTNCLLNPNRNPHKSKQEITNALKKYLGVQKILWLKHGALLGDDTDAHIDTLARFLDPNTIAYIKCEDPLDPHFVGLSKMEEELRRFKTLDNKKYDLVPLPLPKIYEKINRKNATNTIMYGQGEKERRQQGEGQGDQGRRLAASYANFLIIKEVLFLPIYGVSEDELAIKALSKFYKVIPIKCLDLIYQNGSLHCATAPLY
ncbi:MAG: agmatine deiminase family protein [Helicobacter sp.]|nr:agmatine deiminase family protein [Helicobacter sp.]